MPVGKTVKGIEALGSIILISYRDNYLMGRETSFVTDNKTIVAEYKTNTGENIYEGFLSPGSIENLENLKAAKKKFANTCIDLEKKMPDISRVTFADIRDSRSNPGFIAGNPRYVEADRRDLLGFPKGSYENKDKFLENTIIRECGEETGVFINPAKLIDTGILAPTGKKTNYAVYHYKLTKSEYEKATTIIEEKNKSRENELHNIQFTKISNGDPKLFFINCISKEAYSRTVKKRKNRTRNVSDK
jgi:hypothetical protein